MTAASGLPVGGDFLLSPSGQSRVPDLLGPVVAIPANEEALLPRQIAALGRQCRSPARGSRVGKRPR
jgi:hypothetical protein